MAGTRGYKDMIHVKLLNVLLKVIINMGVGDWIYASINVSKYYATHISSMHNYVKDYRYMYALQAQICSNLARWDPNQIYLGGSNQVLVSIAKQFWRRVS